ncbi:MAG: hypothetical protein AB1551_04450 [Actinomycetota bacterium]
MAENQPEDARSALERELYWAEEATPRSRLSLAEVRDALHDFVVLMRDDEKRIVPRGEPNLAARKRWKRRAKYRLFRLFRPISWRYDRLLGDLGELSASLAERVALLEAEVARLREKLDRREGGE